MNVLGILLIGILVSSCTHSIKSPTSNTSTSSSSARAPSSVPQSQLLQAIEEPQAFKGWTTNKSEQHAELDLSRLEVTGISCDSQELTPSHPSMEMKLYFNAKWGRYDDKKVPPNSGLCLIQSRGKKPYCLKADAINYVIVSDLFQDKCGNFYRGYAEVLYQRSHENMGTLFSPGRTMYQNPKSEFEGDLVSGDTYPVNASHFFFFTKATEDEIKQILKNKSIAVRKDYFFDADKNIYRKK